MTAHSPLGGSGASRWINCPGSVRLSKGIEQGSSVYAAEGSVAHALAEGALNRKGLIYKVGEVVEYGGHKIKVNQEMYKHVGEYEDYIRLRKGNDGEMWVEHRFAVPKLHPAWFGTADCVIYKPTESRVIIIDFKYGAGVLVEPDSPQLSYYAIGALMSLGLKAKTVQLVIYQPRASNGPVRSIEREVVDLFDDLANFRGAMVATEHPDAPLQAGSWCRWCPAAASCPEQEALRDIAVNEQFDVIDDSTSDGRLGEYLRIAPIVENWAKRVREVAYERARSGEKIDGYKLVRKLKNNTFRHDLDSTLATLTETAKAEGVDIDTDEFLKARSLKTPNQVSEVLKSHKVPLDVMKELAHRPEGDLVLVPDSNPRPAYERSKPEDEFEIIEGN